MTATIQNFPDKKTYSYAELWAADPFIILDNDWWPRSQLASEDKGDERGVGARYKVDIPGPCWVHWQGTTTGGMRLLQVQPAADGLDNSPGASFLPIESGVNLIAFGDETPEPPPEPPEEPLALEEWLDIFISQPGYNDCQDYGVSIERVAEPEYRVIGLHHLTGAENNGNHNLYIDVVDEDGKLDLEASILGRIQGHPWKPPVRPPDTTTPMWDTPLFKEDGFDVKLLDSDIVTGFSTAHPDEDEGNTLYHHSFYVVFQKVPVAPAPEPPPEPPPPPDVPGLPPDWVPNSIHLYFGGVHDSPVVSYYLEAEFVTLGIQREHYLELWEELKRLLAEAVGG